MNPSVLVAQLEDGRVRQAAFRELMKFPGRDLAMHASEIVQKIYHEDKRLWKPVLSILHNLPESNRVEIASAHVPRLIQLLRGADDSASWQPGAVPALAFELLKSIPEPLTDHAEALVSVLHLTRLDFGAIFGGRKMLVKPFLERIPVEYRAPHAAAVVQFCRGQMPNPSMVFLLKWLSELSPAALAPQKPGFEAMHTSLADMRPMMTTWHNHMAAKSILEQILQKPEEASGEEREPREAELPMPEGAAAEAAGTAEQLDDADDANELVVAGASDRRPKRHCQRGVRIKHEKPDDGMIRCPRCQFAVQASERGCNLMTCRRQHEDSGWFHFCFFCRRSLEGGMLCQSNLCPERIDRESRAQAKKRRNEEAERNPIVLGSDDEEDM